MRKTTLTFSLIAACLSFGIVPSVEANPVLIARQTRLEFQGWELYPSNISYFSSGGRTEAMITLNVRNLISNNALLTGSEIGNLRQVTLVDAQGNAYRARSFNPMKPLNASFFLGEIGSIQLSFETPQGLHPRFLEIPRSRRDAQGNPQEPIRLRL